MREHELGCIFAEVKKIEQGIDLLNEFGLESLETRNSINSWSDLIPPFSWLSLQLMKYVHSQRNLKVIEIC